MPAEQRAQLRCAVIIAASSVAVAAATGDRVDAALALTVIILCLVACLLTVCWHRAAPTATCGRGRAPHGDITCQE